MAFHQHNNSRLFLQFYAIWYRHLYAHEHNSFSGCFFLFHFFQDARLPCLWNLFRSRSVDLFDSSQLHIFHPAVSYTALADCHLPSLPSCSQQVDKPCHSDILFPTLEPSMGCLQQHTEVTVCSPNCIQKLYE